MRDLPDPQLTRRRAGATLAVTFLLVGILGAVGLHVERHLRPTSLAVGGTASDRGEALARSRFGPSSSFVVLLRGPAGSIERQGPRLAARLRRDPSVTVISPWDPAPAAAKLPAPSPKAPPTAASQAVILLDYHVSLDEAMREKVHSLDAVIATDVHPPVTAVQSGYATISRSLQDESLSAAERAELLAAPLLILVLLFVFRSVVAAAIPLVFGALTVFAGRGVLVFLTSAMPIDALSLVVCTMMGLALGVDYSLLIVSRFREELAAGRPPEVAAAATRRTAGLTTVVAGSTLFVSIFLSAFLQAGSLLVSLATALVVVTALAVLIAWAALPALLALLGPRINAGRIGRARPGGGSAVAATASRALRRPAVAATAIAVPLVLLAAPALAFDTGSPGVDELASSSDARRDAESIADSVGAGWEAPFLLTVAIDRGPITAPRRLSFLTATQRRIEHLDDVEAVVGPAAIAAAAGPVRSVGADLGPGASSSVSQLTRLEPRLRRGFAAVSRLQDGLGEAVAGSGLLAEGSARARDGAELLAGGLGRAGAGGDQASSALERLAAGSRRLARGEREAAASGYSLAFGLRTLVPPFEAQALERSRRLASRLDAAAATDPELRPAAHEAAVLVSVLRLHREELQRLRGLARGLDLGLRRLRDGSERLRDGTGQLATLSRSFGGGLRGLGAGARRLAGGLGALSGGAEALRGGLAGGYRRGYRLEHSLRRTGTRLSRSAAPLGRRLSRVHRLSPRLFASGFLPLAAIDGASPLRRSLAAEVLDVSRGGTAARYLIIPRGGFNSAGSRRLGSRLSGIAKDVEDRSGMAAGVSGGAAVLNDYGAATKARLPLVIGAIIIITFLMLIALLRAPLLAALAVALNLLSVAAAVGVVTLACRIPAGYPLGGHPYIDTVGGAAIFGVTFGLSIDYAVFLLARMRERLDLLPPGSGAKAADERHRAAIAFGLEKTAPVITGAAAIMAAVFASFAVAPVATVSQMGLGLTVAVLLDATVVRIVLFPALMLLIGERVWHTPRWLDRLLPRMDQRAPRRATAEAGI